MSLHLLGSERPDSAPLWKWILGLAAAGGAAYLLTRDLPRDFASAPRRNPQAW